MTAQTVGTKTHLLYWAGRSGRGAFDIAPSLVLTQLMGTVVAEDDKTVTVEAQYVGTRTIGKNRITDRAESFSTDETHEIARRRQTAARNA